MRDLKNRDYRRWLTHKLSVGGKYRVVFGEYPDCAEVFEFVCPPSDTEQGIRYINLLAKSDAKVSWLIKR